MIVSFKGPWAAEVKQQEAAALAEAQALAEKQQQGIAVQAELLALLPPAAALP